MSDLPPTSIGTNGSGGKAAVAAAAGGGQAGARNAYAESFAQIVGVLMRDKHFRSATLADLEWLVIPPLLARQFGVAHAAVSDPATGGKAAPAAAGQRLMPVAVALWARVSDRLDKALCDTSTEPPRLRAADWTSGDNIWIMAAAGDHRAIPTFLGQLAAKDFKGRQARMRVRGSDGTVSIRTFGAAAA